MPDMKFICQAPNCGIEFEASKNAKYHNATCRKRAQRAPKPASVAPVIDLPVSDPTPGPLEEVTRRELADLGCLDTSLGVNLLILAHRLDNSAGETGAAVAALEKSFRAARAEALAGVDEDGDELDDIQRDVFTVIAGGRV